MVVRFVIRIFLNTIKNKLKINITKINFIIFTKSPNWDWCRHFKLIVFIKCPCVIFLSAFIWRTCNFVKTACYICMKKRMVTRRTFQMICSCFLMTLFLTHITSVSISCVSIIIAMIALMINFLMSILSTSGAYVIICCVRIVAVFARVCRTTMVFLSTLLTNVSLGFVI